MALAFLAAALLVMLARRMFIADLVARPPVHPIGYGGGRTVPTHITEPPGRSVPGDEPQH